MDRPKMLQIRGRFSYREFDNSDAYYDDAAESRVNERFHKVARNAAYIGLRLRDGRLRMIIPDSVRELNGGPAVIGSLHRSRSDIPYFVKITEAAGLHFTRPLAKEDYFENPPIRLLFSELGAVGVDRKVPNLAGVNKFAEAALTAGYPLLAFTGGTRIRPFDKAGNPVDTRAAEKPKRAAARIAIMNQVPLIPLAFAGLAENDSRWISGLGQPVVAVLGNPIFPQLWSPDQARADDAIRHQSRDLSRQLHEEQQQALDLAYLIREA